MADVAAPVDELGREYQRAERFAAALREVADFDPLTYPDGTDVVHLIQMKAREALLHG